MSDSDPGGAPGPNEAPEELSPPPVGDPPATMGDLLDELEALEETTDDPAVREQVEQLKLVAGDIPSGRFGSVIVGFGQADAAEALLGALLFGVPMFVEGGTLEVGAFVATHPLFLVVTLLATVLLSISILYVADFQDVRIHEPLLGFIPRRLVGILGISFLTATVAMTGWGRVDWAAPWLSVCQISVAFVPMTIGAALGDLLPGS